MNEKLVVWQLNANHDYTATGTCVAQAILQKVDVILFSDPHLHRQTLNAPGWHVFTKPRVALLVRNTLSATVVTLEHDDLVGARILNMLFIAIYSPPAGDLHCALQEVLQLSTTCDHHTTILLGGDLTLTAPNPYCLAPQPIRVGAFLNNFWRSRKCCFIITVNTHGRE